MKPAEPPADAESKILRWLMLVFGVASLIGIAVTGWSTARDCQMQCVAEGASRGVLHFRGSGSFNMGAQCRCESAPK
jgi:hypothetical protein